MRRGSYKRLDYSMGKWDGGVNDDVMRTKVPEIRPRHFFGAFAAFITSSGPNAEIAALYSGM
jgi:hypothetical protein